MSDACWLWSAAQHPDGTAALHGLLWPLVQRIEATPREREEAGRAAGRE